jgi:7-keto-8-aminopelargonate synthetase-like enzyme
MNVHVSNRELGTDEELSDLVNRIRAFDYGSATPKENLALARALKVMAEDVLQRRQKVTELQAELQRKLSLAEVTAEMGEVLKALRPKRTWMWGKKERAW